MSSEVQPGTIPADNPAAMQPVTLPTAEGGDQAHRQADNISKQLTAAESSSSHSDSPTQTYPLPVMALDAKGVVSAVSERMGIDERHLTFDLPAAKRGDADADRSEPVASLSDLSSPRTPEPVGMSDYAPTLTPAEEDPHLAPMPPHQPAPDEGVTKSIELNSKEFGQTVSGDAHQNSVESGEGEADASQSAYDDSKTPASENAQKGMENCSDAAYQGVLHIKDEIANGKTNHDLGMGDDELADYLDTYAMSGTGQSLMGGGVGWYDSIRKVIVIKRGEYSMTAFKTSFNDFQSKLDPTG